MKSSVKKEREPLVHITKRNDMAKWKAWLIRAVAVVIALLIGATITGILSGASGFIYFFRDLFLGVFGTSRRILNFFQDTAIMLVIALALAPAFKMKYWNIGAEGQVLMGGLACVVCIQYLGGTIDDSWLILIMFFAAIAFSVAWTIIPAIFKAQFNTNETLFTLMMNYVAMQLVAICIYIWVPDGSATLGALSYGRFPNLFGQRYIINIIVAFVAMVILFVYFRSSKHGYELSVVGESTKTAKYVGINVKKVIIRTMVLSGVLCGLAGLLLVGGTDYSITTSTVDNRGFTAILVAWLGKFSPFVMGGTSMLYVFIDRGTSYVRTTLGLGGSYPDLITGIFFLLVIACEFFINYQIQFKPMKKKHGEQNIDGDNLIDDKKGGFILENEEGVLLGCEIGKEVLEDNAKELLEPEAFSKLNEVLEIDMTASKNFNAEVTV